MSIEPETDVDNEPEATTRRILDPELRTLNGIIRDLEKFDVDTQARMMNYLSNRYAKKV